MLKREPPAVTAFGLNPEMTGIGLFPEGPLPPEDPPHAANVVNPIKIRKAFAKREITVREDIGGAPRGKFAQFAVQDMAVAPCESTI